jgi:acyl carrier protein
METTKAASGRREFDRDLEPPSAKFCAENSAILIVMPISPDELKAKIIKSLNLQDITPEQIDNDAPLFGAGGLELDSIDALELVVMLEKNYGIVVKDMEEGRPAFKSPNTLTAFINAKRAQ